MMEFTKKNSDDKRSIYLPPRSLYLIMNDARYIWQHGIPSRKKDVINGVEIPRKTRISITFRNVMKSKVKTENIRILHSE